MSATGPQTSTTEARQRDDSSNLSMRDLENEIVDISSSSSGSSSKVKLLFAKSKGISSLCERCVDRSLCASYSKGQGQYSWMVRSCRKTRRTFLFFCRYSQKYSFSNSELSDR